MTFDRGSGAVLELSASDEAESAVCLEDPVAIGRTSPARDTELLTPRGQAPARLPGRGGERFGDGTRSVRLCHHIVAVREARAAIVADLHQRAIRLEIIEEAESVVAELVANAVRHARPLADGCVRVRWKVKAGAVEVEVRDGGSDTMPRPARPAPLALHGRGLRIVRSMAHEWGVQDETNGRTVWAALGGPSRRRAG